MENGKVLREKFLQRVNWTRQKLEEQAMSETLENTDDIDNIKNIENIDISALDAEIENDIRALDAEIEDEETLETNPKDHSFGLSTPSND